MAFIGVALLEVNTLVVIYLIVRTLVYWAHMAQSGIVRNAFPEPKFLSNQTGYRSDLGIKIKPIT